jgi:hypothetical protein
MVKEGVDQRFTQDKMKMKNGGMTAKAEGRQICLGSAGIYLTRTIVPL